MAAADDLEARVTALEEQVRNLTGRVQASEQDAAAARVLAGAADRDVGELRAEMREFREQNMRLHSATREDLTDLRARMESGFAEVDRGFAEVRGRLDATAAGQERIVELLGRLLNQQDEQ
jgi:predicted  nucleic acid-binding Zn-ribbon protein